MYVLLLAAEKVSLLPSAQQVSGAGRTNKVSHQQQMHLKESRGSTPSADFHAATGKALTAG